VSYVEECCLIENAQTLGSSDKRQQDTLNTIKLSEVLLSLKHLQPIVQKESLLKALADKLKARMKPDLGWSYFVDPVASSDRLPTAFATAALYQFGYTEESRKSAEGLYRHLKETYLSADRLRQISMADLTIDVFSLYILTFEAPIGAHDDDLRNVFHVMWKGRWSLIETGSEQNIEYWYERGKSCYVRVPWDLYIIALAAHYDLRNAFCSSALQRRLLVILDQVLDGGFRYSHSGKLVSSRTNAILFEVLFHVRREIEGKSLRTGLKERFDALLASAWTRASLVLLAVGFIVWVLYSWFKSDQAVTAVGPDLIGAIIFGLLGWAWKKPI
jgi:hypothetical protein